MPVTDQEPHSTELSSYAQRLIRDTEMIPGVPELVALGRDVVDLIKNGPTYTETDGTNSWSGKAVETDVCFELDTWKPEKHPQDGTIELAVWPISPGKEEATFVSFYTGPQGDVSGLNSIHLPDRGDGKDTVSDQPISITEAQQKALMGNRITESAALQAKQQVESVKAALTSDRGVVFEVLFHSRPSSKTRMSSHPHHFS